MSSSERTILIVEDDPDAREYLELLLTTAGYRTALAGNGEEALDRLAELAPPAVIVLDLMMPVMSGWELLTVLKADCNLARIPALVLSAAGCPMPQGAAGMLAKPSEPRQLLRLLAELAERERRVDPRLPVELDLTAHLAARDEACRSVNLSRGGILFRASACPRVGQSFSLSVAFEGAPRVRFDGQVRHVEAVENAFYVGARFVDMSASSSSALATRLRELGDSGSG